MSVLVCNLSLEQWGHCQHWKRQYHRSALQLRSGRLAHKLWERTQNLAMQRHLGDPVSKMQAVAAMHCRGSQWFISQWDHPGPAHSHTPKLSTWSPGQTGLGRILTEAAQILGNIAATWECHTLQSQIIPQHNLGLDVVWTQMGRMWSWPASKQAVDIYTSLVHVGITT